MMKVPYWKKTSIAPQARDTIHPDTLPVKSVCAARICVLALRARGAAKGLFLSLIGVRA